MSLGDSIKVGERSKEVKKRGQRSTQPCWTFRRAGLGKRLAPWAVEEPRFLLSLLVRRRFGGAGAVAYRLVIKLLETGCTVAI